MQSKLYADPEHFIRVAAQVNWVERQVDFEAVSLLTLRSPDTES
jgi:hypothetical protein